MSGVSRVTRKPLQPASLRAQFALVLGLLSFLPNIMIVLVLARLIGVGDLGSVLVWMGVVALVSGFIGYVLSRALLQPLLRLTRELDTVGVGGAHADDPGEVTALRGAFTRLLTRLAQEQERRGAFMATLVHDLKTPLVATNHLVAVLRDVPLGDEDRADVCRQIIAENDRLLTLVRHMADAHKFEREGVTLSPEDVDLRAFAEDLVARNAPRAHHQRLDLVVTGEGRAHADVVQLERAVTNLLDNALRYARTHVEVRVAPACVGVGNDGPPLARPLAELAQPFNAQPVEIAGQRYTAGTAGLGLFIVRRIAEAHGGALAYRRDGERSIFEISLRGPDATRSAAEVGSA